MQTEQQDTHGHEVIHMMITSGKTYSNESLQKEIEANFGETTRFYTCAGDGLTAEGLIDVFWRKGKFSGTPEAFVFDPQRQCNH